MLKARRKEVPICQCVEDVRYLDGVGLKNCMGAELEASRTDGIYLVKRTPHLPDWRNGYMML